MGEFASLDDLQNGFNQRIIGSEIILDPEVDPEEGERGLARLFFEVDPFFTDVCTTLACREFLTFGAVLVFGEVLGEIP